jgi:hypothetical protein
MLGCASERAFNTLFEAYVESIDDDKKREEWEKKSEWFLKRRIDVLKRELYWLREKKTLPPNISDDIDTQFEGICTLIRNCRNEVGHPSGKKMSRSQVFINLRLFIPYCKKVYELKDYFEKNKVKVFAP